MDDEEIKKKLEQMRKNRIVLTDDRPMRANIARGTLEPVAKKPAESAEPAPGDWPKGAAGKEDELETIDWTKEPEAPKKEPDVAAIMEERGRQRQAQPIRPPIAAQPARQPAPQEKPPEVAKPNLEESKPAAISKPAATAKPAAIINIARGTIEEPGKPARKKLAPLPKPPSPPYGREKGSFFDAELEKQAAIKPSRASEPAGVIGQAEREQSKAEPQAPVKLSPEAEKLEETQFAQDLVSEKAGESEEQRGTPAARGHLHRQYLHGLEAGSQAPAAQKSQEEQMAEEILPQVKKVTAYAPADAAKREETAETLAAAHSQLSDTTKPLSRHDKRKLEEEQQKQPAAAGEAKQPEEPKHELTLADIIGPESGEKPAPLFGALDAAAGGASGGAATADTAEGGNSLFGELESMAGGAVAKSPSVVNVEVQKKDASLACPTCKAQNTRVVFCPYCGTGMCANCSPAIRTEGDLFIFTCPKCSEEVNVAKKA